MKFVIPMLIVLFASEHSFAEEIKIRDLVNIKGVRTNQLIGVGLITGLQKTGDSAKSIMTNKTASAMLNKLGMKIGEKELLSGTMAVVILTAELPPFAKIGDKIDVKASTLGDSSSLAGGTLLLSHLRAGDQEIYASAQGSIQTAQATGTGSKVQTVALLPNAAQIEKEFQPVIDKNGHIQLSLRHADSTLNRSIVDKINEAFRGFYAVSQDIAGIRVRIPAEFEQHTVEFISEVENLKVNYSQKAMVVINERTGTVIMGGEVYISPVTISHGDLSITIGGQNKKEKPQQQRVMNIGGSTVQSLIESMTSMGMKPADLMSILQSLNQAGALQGELKIL